MNTNFRPCDITHPLTNAQHAPAGIDNGFLSMKRPRYSDSYFFCGGNESPSPKKVLPSLSSLPDWSLLMTDFERDGLSMFPDAKEAEDTEETIDPPVRDASIDDNYAAALELILGDSASINTDGALFLFSAAATAPCENVSYARIF